MLPLQIEPETLMSLEYGKVVSVFSANGVTDGVFTKMSEGLAIIAINGYPFGVPLSHIYPSVYPFER